MTGRMISKKRPELAAIQLIRFVQRYIKVIKLWVRVRVRIRVRVRVRIRIRVMIRIRIRIRVRVRVRITVRNQQRNALIRRDVPTHQIRAKKTSISLQVIIEGYL